MSGAAPDAFAEASRLHAAGRLAEVPGLLEALLAEQPAHHRALNLLGISRGQLGELEAGCSIVERALQAAPGDPVYLRNLCELRRQNGQPSRAVQAGRQAVAVAPADTIARLNLAMAEQDALLLDDAMANARHVLAAEPENGSAHFLVSQIQLLRGVMDEGWAEYAWRWRIPGADRPQPDPACPEWDGAPIAGRLLVLADQGFGDMLQFARLLPWAAARCGELVVTAPYELRGILARIVPACRIAATASEAGPAEAHTILSSLPGIAGLNLDTLPAASGYLAPDPVHQARWTARLAQLAPRAPGVRRIGLAWAGRREHRADRQRSMRLADFAPLTGQPGLCFVSLQKGEAAQQVGGYFGPAPLVNLGPEFDDFDDTAAVLTQLDMLVTVDTSVAHLAGALGVPAHVLIPSRPDWRWLLGRNDTPWYDSITLWRDPAPGGRSASVKALATTLCGV